MLAQLAEKAIGQKVGILGCQNDAVEHQFLHAKSQQGQHHHRYGRTDEVFAQLLQMVEKRHLLVVLLKLIGIIQRPVKI